MELKWFNILIEIGFFLVLALLYYIYQKKKIIRFDKMEIFQMVDEFSIKLNYYLDAHKASQNYQPLNLLCSEIETAIELNEFDKLLPLLNQMKDKLPLELRDISSQIIETIENHNKL